MLMVVLVWLWSIFYAIVVVLHLKKHLNLLKVVHLMDFSFLDEALDLSVSISGHMSKISQNRTSMSIYENVHSYFKHTSLD